MASATMWCTYHLHHCRIAHSRLIYDNLDGQIDLLALGVLACCIKLYYKSATTTTTEDNAQEFQLAELGGGGGGEMSAETRLEISNWTISSLPPVQSYEGGQDVPDCTICMEGFQIGSSVQSFGVCGHGFHQACLHSLLQTGKSTCPVCRLDLFV